MVPWPYLVQLMMHQRRVVLSLRHRGQEHLSMGIRSTGRAWQVERRGGASVEPAGLLI